MEFPESQQQTNKSDFKFRAVIRKSKMDAFRKANVMSDEHDAHDVHAISDRTVSTNFRKKFAFDRPRLVIVFVLLLLENLLKSRGAMKNLEHGRI